jgi:hypothetical protein
VYKTFFKMICVQVVCISNVLCVYVWVGGGGKDHTPLKLCVWVGVGEGRHHPCYGTIDRS